MKAIHTVKMILIMFALATLQFSEPSTTICAICMLVILPRIFETIKEEKKEGKNKKNPLLFYSVLTMIIIVWLTAFVYIVYLGIKGEILV